MKRQIKNSEKNLSAATTEVLGRVHKLSDPRVPRKIDEDKQEKKFEEI